jgi:hypothetical protein
MAETQAGNGNGQPFDPIASWREMRDNYLEAWAKAMIGVVNTEAYAKSTGTMLDSVLAISAPMRETMHDVMTQALASLSMPSRGEIVSLAERMTQVEMRLDDMDAKLDRIEAMLSRPAEPRRTRKKGA